MLACSGCLSGLPSPHPLRGACFVRSRLALSLRPAKLGSRGGARPGWVGGNFGLARLRLRLLLPSCSRSCCCCRCRSFSFSCSSSSNTAQKVSERARAQERARRAAWLEGQVSYLTGMRQPGKRGGGGARRRRAPAAGGASELLAKQMGESVTHCLVAALELLSSSRGSPVREALPCQSGGRAAVVPPPPPPDESVSFSAPLVCLVSHLQWRVVRQPLGATFRRGCAPMRLPKVGCCAASG